MKPSLLTLALLVGCTAEDTLTEPFDNYEPPRPSGPLHVQALSHDCGLLGESGLESFEPALGTLHVIGIDQARNHDDPFSDPVCQECLANPECIDFATACGPKIHPATVDVVGVKTLVLTSAAPVEWTVTASATLERVILSGDAREQSKVIVPAGVEIKTFDLGFATQWITDEELALSCEDVMGAAFCAEESLRQFFEDQRAADAKAATDLVSNAEDLTGDKLGTFHGCRMMSKIALGPEVCGPSSPQ